MQTETAFLRLGLHPTAEYDGTTVVENQFLNVGRGVHVKTIRDVLDEALTAYLSGQELLSACRPGHHHRLADDLLQPVWQWPARCL